MSTLCTSRFFAEIDSLLLGQPSPRRLRRLRAHLAGCSACQRRYNKVVLAARLLEGGPSALAVPSQSELERVGAEVMQRVVPSGEPRPLRRWLPSLVAALTTCGLVLAIALPRVMRRAPSPGDEAVPGVTESAARGASGAGIEEHAAKPAAVGVGLRVFCVRAGGEATAKTAPAELRAAPGGAAADSCSTADRLKLTYATARPYPILIGLDEHHQLKWYQAAEDKSKQSAAPERMVPLSAEHRPGLLRIYAISSSRPLDAEAVEKAAAQAVEGGAPQSAAELPLAGTVQQSILIRLQPPPR